MLFIRYAELQLSSHPRRGTCSSVIFFTCFCGLVFLLGHHWPNLVFKLQLIAVRRFRDGTNKNDLNSTVPRRGLQGACWSRKGHDWPYRRHMFDFGRMFEAEVLPL